MKRKAIYSGLCFAAMIILTLDSKNAVLYAKDGIELCIYTVIPALFPYCVLSLMLQSGISGTDLKLFRPIERLLNMPKGSGIVFVLGILGGYPTGAICAEKMDIKDINKMSAYCNNAGPSFIFGILPVCFSSVRTIILVWIIQIFSACITALIINPKEYSVYHKDLVFNTKPNVITDAAKAMLSVSAMIILFKVLTGFLSYRVLALFPKEFFPIITGFIELTNGIITLQQIPNESLRFIICCGMLSFGGLCVAFQTASISKRISIKKYLSGKIIQSIISILVAIGIVYKQYFLIFVISSILMILLKVNHIKKEVAFSS